MLWLLHGYGGDDTDWLRYTQLTRYVARYPLIVVLPSVGNSFYVNSRADSTARYEDFLVQELHTRITRDLSVDTLREAVAGQSMGGYGALMLGLRYPYRYVFFLIGASDELRSFRPRNRAFTGHSRQVWNAALPPMLARLWIEVTAPARVH